ncbi:MAG: M28 family peptidase [Planctomycetes bacterium]|nr:M28 family peptidase [Planctomycetota bacterium]
MTPAAFGWQEQTSVENEGREIANAVAEQRRGRTSGQDDLVALMHSISSHTLYDYVAEMCKEKYAGRLTGTEEYNEIVRWVAGYFKKWGVKPVGDKGTYLQGFPNPYTLIFPDCQAYLHVPNRGGVTKKQYSYYDEFIPGSTSGSGEVTAEVIFVGYGITAPELGYDDYAGLDVRGKILLMNPEGPVGTGAGEAVFMPWRPYTFHQYKLQNAVRHGARGMIYNYGPIGNPNNAYDANFIYTHVGPKVVNDVFAGTGRDYNQVIRMIQSTFQPQSFATGKVFTLKNTTKHFPKGIGYNVIGMIEGSDAKLKSEVIMVGGHLDHLGLCWEMMPGANDNASAVAVIMGVAETISKMETKPRRSIMFNCFGAEEQGVAGSDYYLKNPIVPLEKIVGLINMDGVGVGTRISAGAGRNYPAFYKFFETANDKYIHRQMSAGFNANLGRPRLDAARFMWAGVPSLSFGTGGGGPTYYHTPGDNLDIITPEIMEDFAQLVFMAVVDMANQNVLNFRN